MFLMKEQKMMKKQSLILILFSLLLMGTLLAGTPSLIKGSVVAQSSFQTATPNADGQILYTVQEGDSCTRIFLLTGVSIEQIIQLNNLDADCSLTPSQQLILGTVAPATATPEGPLPTPTIGPPTATPFNGNAELCVVLYEDLDGNQKRSEDEFYLAGGVVSVNNRTGTFSETRETVGGDPEIVDPVCLQDVPEGEYNLSMGIPDGFNPTTSLNYALTLTAGDTVVIDFGAQPSSAVAPGDVEDGGGNRSPLLLAIGLFMLAGGAGLAFFFIRSRQN